MIVILAKIEIVDGASLSRFPQLILDGVEKERLSNIRVAMEVEGLYFPIIDYVEENFLGRSLRPLKVVRAVTKDFESIDQLAENWPSVKLIDLMSDKKSMVFSYCESIRDGSGRFITSSPVHYSGKLVIWEDVP